MEVCVSGPVWSSLVLELANSKGDSEGFLIGDACSQVLNSISDSSSQHLKYQRIATIQGLIPCIKAFSFYDNVGKIDQQKFQETVYHQKENIIGWYRFRRNTQQLVAMRERRVHHNIIKELRFTPSQEFLFIVFTASIETGLSVHSLNYTIYSSLSVTKCSPFNSHELKVINLGDTSHSEYKLTPDTIRTPSRVFLKVTDAYREDFVDKDGCLHQPISTHSMHISLMTKMKEILIEVKNSESTVGAMAEQVESLREQVDKLKNKQLEEKRLLEENEVVTAQLIEIKDTNTKKSTNNLERVVQGSEATRKNLRTAKHSNHVRRRQAQASATNNLIDLSEDNSTKRPFIKHPSNQSPDMTATEGPRPGVGSNDADDDDDTQDFSLPDSRQQSNATLQQQTMMESMSPTF